MATVPSIGRADALAAGAPAESTRDLYERYGRQIFTYCMVELRNREDAEDAVQTTFLNAFRGLERGVVPELESAWLYKIAQNVCHTKRRSFSRRRRVESPEDFDTVQELFPAPARDAEDIAGLTEALRALPEQQRRAILLREWQGLTYKEIAAELDLSQAAVETLIFRARRGLAQSLERLRASGDLGSIAAAIKSLLLGLGTKAAVTVATVATTSVVAATPQTRHELVHFVDAVSNVAAPAPVATHAAATPAHAAREAARTVVSATPQRTPNLSRFEPEAAGEAGAARTREPVTPPLVTPPPAVTPAAGDASPPPASVPGPATATPPAAPVTPAVPAPETKASSRSGDDGPPARTAATPAPGAAPLVAGFSPSSGPAGTLVQIGGRGLGGATAVRFNGASAELAVVSDTRLTARVPAGATSGPVTVVTPNGTVTSGGSFTVATPPAPAPPAPPSIGGASPASGLPGTTVQITGSRFTGATAVRFNGTSADFVVSSDTLITARVPSNATSGPVTVVTPGGSASGAGFTVSAPPPSIGGTSPASAPAGATVGIIGGRFTGATAVKFNGTSAEFTVTSDTQITARVPAGATSGPITVVTPNGTATSGGSFTVTAPPPPTVSGLSPTTGPVGTTVQIGGHNFTGATAVKFNGVPASFTVSSEGQIAAQVPAGATSGPVSVTTPNGTSAGQGSFTVVTPTPEIGGFSPGSAATGATVTIGGRNLAGATSVKFNGVPASFTVNQEGQIAAVVPAGATSGPVSVTTPAGTATSSGSFTVTH